MKQKIKQSLMAIVGLLLSTSVFAHDFEVDGIYYNYIDETAKTVEVTYKGSYYYSYDNEYTGSVTIPSTVTYNGTTYSVTSIGYSAFCNCTGLTEATIPNSVTEIGTGAFYNCTGITSVTIPNSVTSIGESAFSGCTGLTSIAIPNSVTSIDSLAFYSCTGLTSVTIPNSVTEIGEYAFMFCTGLTEVTIGNSVTSIDSFAFYRCTGLTSFTIPNSVTEIGESAFAYCTGLTSVSIPNSVTSIGNDAFYNTAWYDNQAIGVIYINNVLYKYKGTMTEGTSISIKDGTKSISPSAFFACFDLISVTIPNSVTSIGNDAFAYCIGLTEVTIPNSVTSIGNGTFRGCEGLTSMVVASGNSVYDSRDNCNAIIETTTNTLISGCINTIIPNSVTLIGDWAFSSYTSLTSVTIPNSVTSIGEYAFMFCTELTEVTIGNSVTEIGTYAFYDCGLSVVYSYNVTPPSCADGAFGGDTNSSYSALLKVPEGSKEAYANATEWDKFTNIQEIAGVEGIEADNNSFEVVRYDIHGCLLADPTKGINIIKMSDGSTRKEIVKE